MLSQVVYLVAAVSPTLVALVVARVKSEDARWRSWVPGLIATSAGLTLSIATYLWVFEDGQCGGTTSFTCRINGNQGILTLLTIVLAVLALWATALTRVWDRTEAARASAKHFSEVLDAAIAELRHNLIHVAMAFNDAKQLEVIPQIQTSRLEEALTPDLRGRLDRRVRSYADATIRNGTKLQGLEVPPDGSAPEELRYFTQTCLLLMNRVVASQANHPDWLHTDPIVRDMVEAMQPGAPCPFFSSLVRNDLPRLRTEELPVFCWWKDEELQGVHVIEMGQRVRDYQIAYMGSRKE